MARAQSFFPLLALLLWSCASSPTSGPTPVADPSLTGHQHWARAVNSLPDSLADLYTAEAILVTTAGEVIQGAAAIARAYGSSSYTVDTVFTAQEISADREGRFTYEIGGFRTGAGEDYLHLLIWDTEPTRKQRVLELIAPARPVPSAREAIDQRRAEWIERCNAHDAQALIVNLYAPHTVYYDHRQPVTGREALTAAYAYMNNPNYQLHLEPLAFAMVNEDLAYEIGQCSGSYGGKYLIAWQRDSNGQWYVLLDSNI